MLSIGKLAIQLTTPLLLHKPCKCFASVARVCQRQLAFLVFMSRHLCILTWQDVTCIGWQGNGRGLPWSGCAQIISSETDRDLAVLGCGYMWNKNVAKILHGNFSMLNTGCCYKVKWPSIPIFLATVLNFDGLSHRDTEFSGIPNTVPILPRFECNVTSHVDKICTYCPNTLYQIRCG